MFVLNKLVIAGLAALALLAVLATGLGTAAYQWNAAVSLARTHAIAERDAHWSAEIAKSNAIVQAARAEQAIAAAAASALAAASAAREAQLQSELESKNAALPDANALGLSRERVHLLGRPNG